jgi:hypothetical protein
MAAPYVEAEADEFNYLEDWREQIADQSPESTHMSNDIQEATLFGYVKANKIRSACRWFCGFAQADTSDPWLLRRELPQWHPEHPQLRAYDVSISKLVPKTNFELTGPIGPKIISPFDPLYYSAYYEEALLAVRYRNFLYKFREDDDLPTSEDEWRRYTFVQTEPQVEALTITGGMSQMRFCEGNPAAGLTLPKLFGAPFAELLFKKLVTVTWFDVPWEFLSDNDDIFTPTKLDAIQGHVNDDVFMDIYEPGTLLALGYSIAPSTWAVAPQDMLDPLRKVTVTMKFSWFDPPRGAAAPLARGHCLMPWGGDGAGGGDGRFYLATRNGNADGQRLIPSTTFSFIWTHVGI